MRKTLIALLLAGFAAGGTAAASAGGYEHCDKVVAASYAQDEGTAPQCDAELPARSHRVWTFAGELNAWDEGVLDVTVLRVGKHEFDEPTAVYVLVGEWVRVYDRKGKRAAQGALGDAEGVAVRARLLRRADWRTDEDGDPVPTFRAKKVRITG